MHTTAENSRRLKVVPVRRSDDERKTALRQARWARSELERRSRRFAHLKKMYD